MGLAPTAPLDTRALISVLRTRAREATLTLLCELLNAPQGTPLTHTLKTKPSQSDELTERLWREGLTLTYRALCLLSLCARPPEAQHAWLLTPEWRERFDPWAALVPLMLGGEEGLAARLSELWARLRTQSPRLDGAIFGEESAPTLEPLLVSDESVRRWLSHLMWRQGEASTHTSAEPLPLPYEALSLEGLGAVYEGLLQYSLGYARRPMERVRRGDVEVVSPQRTARGARLDASDLRLVELIFQGSLYLTHSLTRKDSGSYYTPPELSRTLALAALGPLLKRLSDPLNPQPAQILKLSVLDPAMGSAHALLAAARLMGETLERSLLACVEAHHQGAFNERLEVALEVAPLLRTPLKRALNGEPLPLKRACVACVVERCLYGVDLNPFACALAQLSLWLEAYSERSISELTHGRLVCGDALSAPPLHQLLTLPKSAHPLPTALRECLEGLMMKALQGDTPLLEAFKRLNAVWVGVVMSEKAEGVEGEARYLKLCVDLSEGELKRFAWRLSRSPLKQLSARGARALPFELIFPQLTSPQFTSPQPTSPQPTSPQLSAQLEPQGMGEGAKEEAREGAREETKRAELTFKLNVDVVIGNPPWEKVVASEREFYATRDVRVLAAPTARERAPLIERLKRRKEVREAWTSYEAPLRGLRAVVERVYRWQRVTVNRPGLGEGVTLGHGDLYRYFVERSWGLLKPGGRCALLLPNALYASESATGVRRLLLEQSAWRLCLGWVNTHRLFEIGTQQRFCLIAFERSAPSPDHTLNVRFGLKHPRELESPESVPLLSISYALIKATSPTFLCLLELRSQLDLTLITEIFSGGETFGAWSEARGVFLYQELNMTLDAPRLTPSQLHTRVDPRREPERGRLWSEGWLTVHEKGTFSAFDDLLKERPRHLCHLNALSALSAHQEEREAQHPSLRDKKRAREASAYFRIAARAVIHAREENKAAFTLLPPQCVVTNSALVERHPERRTLRDALTLIGVANSRPFNYVARLRVGTNLNQFLLNALPFPPLSAEEESLIAEGVARLCAQHEAYAPMWRAIFDEAWSERCVLNLEERWAIRAELDALIAHAYGLSLSAYEHLLRSFEHSEAPYASDLCLKAYQRLLSER